MQELRWQSDVVNRQASSCRKPGPKFLIPDLGTRSVLAFRIQMPFCTPESTQYFYSKSGISTFTGINGDYTWPGVSLGWFLLPNNFLFQSLFDFWVLAKGYGSSAQGTMTRQRPKCWDTGSMNSYEGSCGTSCCCRQGWEDTQCWSVQRLFLYIFSDAWPNAKNIGARRATRRAQGNL